MLQVLEIIFFCQIVVVGGRGNMLEHAMPPCPSERHVSSSSHNCRLAKIPALQCTQGTLRKSICIPVFLKLGKFQKQIIFNL